MNSLNVLITGAASGIGYAAAHRFSELGHRVFAIDIKDTEHTDGIEAFLADVTSEGDMARVYNALAVRGIMLDVIICAAGVHAMTSLVEGEYAKMKGLVDINLCGAMLTSRTFHSLLSKNGRIIIITSEVATYAPMPFNGLYNISKTALDCYASALRQELNLLGQRVIVIRPGAVKTPLASGSATATEKLAESTVLYKKEAKHFSSLVAKFTGVPINPEKIAHLIAKAATARHPRLSYSKHRNPGLVLLSILPNRLQLIIIKLLLNRK